MRGSVDMNFMFTLGELQRLVRAYADKQAAHYGITRAQWAVSYTHLTLPTIYSV